MKHGLVGSSVENSLSPSIHKFFSDVEYKLFSLNDEEFKDFMLRKDFDCINVTKPYKEEAIKYLDYVSPLALRIGSVNTIKNVDGKLEGYNTDYYGFSYILNKYKIDVFNKDCVILGSGGTSKTVKTVLEDLNAKKIRICSRNHNKGISYNELEKDKDVQVIINTTPVGSFPDLLAKPLNTNTIPNLESIVDVLYNPFRTMFTLNAKNRNINVAYGFDMLVSQAKAASEIFFNKKIDDEIIDRITNTIYKKDINIILIGMMGSGKTTIGKKLALSLNKEFVDTDVEVEKYTNRSISDIFLKEKEEGFRRIESKIVNECALKRNSVIATGGGVVLNKDNINLLSTNGIVVFINRDINDIIRDILKDDNRPLAKTKDEIISIYNDRINLYLESADIIVNEDCVEKAIEEIIKKIGKIYDYNN